MQAVILAAGGGGRLRASDADLPKPLFPLCGRPIIRHVLDALASCGVIDVTVVVGAGGDEVRRALGADAPPSMRLRFVENADARTGNARSFWLAAEDRREGFLLTMADHIIEPAIVRAVIDGADDRSRLAVEMAAPHDARASTATLARVVDGRVVDLGKGIAGWNALDTGVFWCEPGIADAVEPDLRDGELAAVFAALARAGRLDAVDVTGMRWIDIDTPKDLREAEAMLAAHGRLD